MDEKAPESKKKSGNALLRFSGMAFQMGVTIAACAIGGNELDKYQQNEKPIWTIVLSLIGIFASLYLVIRQANKLSDE